MGIHNYYCIATKCSLDFKNVARSINFVLQNRLMDRLRKQGTLYKNALFERKLSLSALWVKKHVLKPQGMPLQLSVFVPLKEAAETKKVPKD